ncbi:MAG: hypothetical protein OJF52_001885 [Nitrospira sp.]|jgi:hypothetical protein|nr:MAG: hypothetical protein OJF52_001885 [Nitrospira sp.]
MSWNEEARISCRFRFKCPQTWNRLQATDVEGVRHCPECERDVYLAMTEEDFRRHSEEGLCIAVPVLQPDKEAELDRPVYAVGMAQPPYRPGLKPVP